MRCSYMLAMPMCVHNYVRECMCTCMRECMRGKLVYACMVWAHVSVDVCVCARLTA